MTDMKALRGILAYRAKSIEGKISKIDERIQSGKCTPGEEAKIKIDCIRLVAAHKEVLFISNQAGSDLPQFNYPTYANQ